MAYCMAMVFMFLKVFRMADILGSLNLSSSIFIDGVCVAALAPAVITMIMSIFQHSIAHPTQTLSFNIQPHKTTKTMTILAYEATCWDWGRG